MIFKCKKKLIIEDCLLFNVILQIKNYMNPVFWEDTHNN